MKNKISGTELLNIGFTPGPQIGVALELIASAEFQNHKQAMDKLKTIAQNPINYLKDDFWSELAKAIIKDEKDKADTETIALNESKDFNVFGRDYIEEGAFAQMQTAMKLPITEAGALMPDAHQGYGLPIGGVLATKNAIIPYAVGVDIGCRMALSIFDMPASYLKEHRSQFKRELIAHTVFGAGAGFTATEKTDHAVLENSLFETNAFIKNLKDKAYAQLGSSGGGNHFVEWGIIEFSEADEALNIPKGKYVALLTHSGSRGMGATIANYYTKLAREKCRLPDEAKHLAYLDMNTEDGQAYWHGMNLAGDYASACHEVIHNKMRDAMGGTLLAKIENHHNFAWKETYHGEEVIVHRKGATPAGKDVMGIIPGSMTAPGFLVRGKGHEASINSASHGAGRQMSRSKAMRSYNKSDLKDITKKHDVELVGGGIDEIPMAYKNIEDVIKAQNNLIDVVATFTPKIVRMADDSGKQKRRR